MRRAARTATTASARVALRPFSLLCSAGQDANAEFTLARDSAAILGAKPGVAIAAAVLAQASEEDADSLEAFFLANHEEVGSAFWALHTVDIGGRKAEL